MDRVALAKLDELCDRANRVVSMREIMDGDIDEYTIGMRHDCDDRAGDSILPLAQWEARRGRRSTFYLLHTAPWYERALEDCLPAKLQALGHEVGLHYNWVPKWEALRVDPCAVLDYELHRLKLAGATVSGAAGHGDDACYRTKLVNYSMFTDSGEARFPWRSYEEATGNAQVNPCDLGLSYLAEFLPKSLYISDSGDTWQPKLSEAADLFPAVDGPTVILQHPDWYAPRLFA